jgi:hypothetical protein
MLRQGVSLLLGAIALSPSGGYAREVTILCDLMSSQGQIDEHPITRRYTLDDEKQIIMMLTPTGEYVNPCRQKCDMRYTPESVSYTYYLGKVRGADIIQFSLNRVSGQLIETWRTPRFHINQTMTGLCQAADAGSRKF